MLYDVIVVGGGAAGLYFGVINENLKVLILEKSSVMGEKLSITGGGRCNITQHAHYKDMADSFGVAARFTLPAFSKLTPYKFRRDLEKKGIPTIVDDRFRVYPTHQSALRLSQEFCNLANAEKMTGVTVTGITEGAKHFTVHTTKGNFLSRYVLVAGGGYQENGMHEPVRELGHIITPLRPALVGIQINDDKIFGLAGLSIIGSVKFGNNKPVVGELVFTHVGVSGPVILDMSTNLENGSSIYLSFVNSSTQHIEDALMEYAITHGAQPVSSFLKTLVGFQGAPLSQRIRKLILYASGIEDDLKCSQVSASKRKTLAKMICEYKLEVVSTNGFEHAKVTKGGVFLQEVDRTTMQSSIVNRLYFAGEILDVDGPSGGYNLQWAFSSANLAYQSIVKDMQKNKF